MSTVAIFRIAKKQQDSSVKLRERHIAIVGVPQISFSPNSSAARPFNIGACAHRTLRGRQYVGRPGGLHPGSPTFPPPSIRPSRRRLRRPRRLLGSGSHQLKACNQCPNATLVRWSRDNLHHGAQVQRLQLPRSCETHSGSHCDAGPSASRPDRFGAKTKYRRQR